MSSDQNLPPDSKPFNCHHQVNNKRVNIECQVNDFHGNIECQVNDFHGNTECQVNDFHGNTECQLNDFHDNTNNIIMTSLKSNGISRVPSPDSACEQDWTPTSIIQPPPEDYSQGVSTVDDTTSDTSDSTNTSDQNNNTLNTNSLSSGENQIHNMQQGGEKRGPNGGVHLQDSDGDSGIVAISRRIGSVCSNETDCSQDNIRRKPRDTSGNNSLELPNKYSLKPTLKSSSVSNLHSCNGPMKDGRNILLESGPSINRSIPLAVHSSSFKDLSSPRVRFDEDLQLTEHNIRRSCRKLFASLYAQKTAAVKSGSRSCPYSSSGTPDGVHSNLSETSRSIRSGRIQDYTFNLTQETSGSSVSGMKFGSQTLPSKTFRTSWSHGVDTTKHPAYKTRYLLGQQLSVPLDLSSVSHLYNSNTNREKNDTEKYISRSNSDIYAGATSTVYQTTKDIQPKHSCWSKTTKNFTNLQTAAQTKLSESSHISNMPSCTNLSERQQPSKAFLFKSKSCTTLPSQTNLRTVDIPSLDPYLYLDQDESLDLTSSHRLVSKVKNPSCKNVRLDRDSDCVLYSDDMIKVYAHLASVVPEGTKVQEETVLSNSKSTENKLQYSFKSGYSQTSKYAHCTQVLRDSEDYQTFDADNQIKESLFPDNCSASKSFAHHSSLSTVTHALLNYNSERHEHVVAAEDNRGAGEGGNNPEFHAISTLNNQDLISVKAKQVGMTEHAVIKNRKSCRSQDITSLPRVISNPCITSGEGSALCHEQESPVPPKMLIHRSDFALYKGSSPSKKSIRERVQGFTRYAKSALQKAFSTERVYRPDKEERLENARRSRRSHSFMKSLRIRMSMRGDKRKTLNQSDTVCHDSIMPHSSPHTSEDTSMNTLPLSDHVWGQLVQLHVDGSQVVELKKPPKKPFGFFVARGRIKNCKGVFVSRMRDHETMNLLSGLIDIGDEILEIDGVNVKEKDIIEVNNLMAKKNNIFLTILPFSSRKDV
ncbi:dentin sialophosphoprotein-like [Limulus polyphemus]|uniref:Dentin sialophosphoprotein-like n=1 Tax=Limulus polyphemus TaxID=6850 RepID=A0ABM1B0P4_LIMPO|nr:dentin sialophosphoprotein-like [Limulus polyphemus]